MKSSPLARTGKCEGYEIEPTQTLVNAIYACANEQVLPLMQSMDDLLLFDINGDGTGVALSTLWLGKSICLLFACRLVLAMTNVVARDSYYNVIGEALYEMTERLKAISQRKPKDYEWTNTGQFMDLVLSVEAHLFHHGKFKYVCSPDNELMRFDGQGRYPICIDTQHLWTKITSATGEDVVCYFKQTPEQLSQPITTRSIETLLDYLRKERHSERLKYEPDPKHMNPLASGTFGSVYTRLLDRTLPSEKRVAEKIIVTERGSSGDKYDHGMEDDHVREIVILNLEPVRKCKFMAKLLDVVVDPINHKIHLYMPWRISLKQYMTEMYHKNAVDNGDTHPMQVVKSMTCQMLVALEVNPLPTACEYTVKLVLWRHCLKADTADLLLLLVLALLGLGKGKAGHGCVGQASQDSPQLYANTPSQPTRDLGTRGLLLPALRGLSRRMYCQIR